MQMEKVFQLSLLDIIVIVAYFALTMGVGIVMGRRVKGVGDFFSGGKKVPWWMGAISSYMAMISSFVLLALGRCGRILHKPGWSLIIPFIASVVIFLNTRDYVILALYVFSCLNALSFFMGL